MKTAALLGIRACLFVHLGWLATATVSSQNISSIINSGFEDAENLGAWRQWIYRDGAAPIIRADPAVAKVGRQSLLIQADEPADVALGQVVALPAGTIWRAKAWVKTEDLRARDQTDTGAALHMQTPDGATLARGPSTFGSSDWKETEVFFRVPPDGQAKVVLFFIGYGKGTGKAWFDEIRLEPIGTGARLEAIITSERLGTRPVDPKQGGQFIEPLCNLIPSLLAQQVANTSFEHDPPWKVAFKRDIDRPHRPWYPDGAVHRAQYTYDTNGAFNGQRSLRITVAVPRARAGISQDGFYFKEGLSYRLRLHMRGTSNVAVQATLHGEGAPAAAPAELGRVTQSWKAAEATIKATRTVQQGTLTISFEGPGTVWLDRASLISSDAVLGLWRRDAVEAVREMRPGVIRFGGSALESYEWDACLGNWDKRAPFPQTYWGGLEENFVGVEEFVSLCQFIGVEPLVCVRWTGKTPADVAAEVEYFNGPPDSKWGRRRAANGRLLPYKVKYWQIGNEVGGREYENSVKAFAQAMKQVDSSIKILSSFPSERLLQVDGGYLDYLCPHHYACADVFGTERDFLALEEQIRRYGGGRELRIAVTEWNTTAGDWELGRGALQTLGNALHCSRYHQLMHRHADAVEIAIRSNLIDSFCSGVILTGPAWLYVAPTYHAQVLYARAAGSYPLRIEHRASGSNVNLPSHLAEPELSALISPDGKTLRLYGVNSTPNSLQVKTRLGGFSQNVDGAEKHVLKDSQGALSTDVMNSRDEPDRVRVFVQKQAIGGTEITLSFEPFSLTLYEIKFAQPRSNE